MKSFVPLAVVLFQHRSSIVMASEARADGFDTTTLKCNLDDNDTEDFVAKEFEFWYGVQVNSTESDCTSGEFLRELEAEIFGATSIWCYGDLVEISARNLVGHTKQNFNRHRDLVEERRLGILGKSSSPMDLFQSDYQCSFTKEDDTTGCCIFQGKMTLFAGPKNDLAYTIASLRDGIEESMETDALLGSSIPTVNKVTYLGDSIEDALVVGGTTAKDQIIPPGIIQTVDPNNNGGAQRGSNSSLATKVTVPIFAAAAVAMLLLLFVKRRRAEDEDITLVGGELDSSDFVLVGTGDPPGSFHHGLHHYMRGGQRFLSTNCSACIETYRNSFQDGLSSTDGLPTIMEDEILLAANSKDLGAPHMGMDVHNCSSATCKHCLYKNADVAFIRSDSTKAKATLGYSQTDLDLNDEFGLSYSSSGGNTEDDDAETNVLFGHVEV